VASFNAEVGGDLSRRHWALFHLVRSPIYLLKLAGTRLERSDHARWRRAPGPDENRFGRPVPTSVPLGAVSP